MAQRTNLQNRSLHKFCEMVADALNDAGLDMKTVLKPGIEIAWTQDNVKEYLWRPIQKAMYPQKESTTDLNTVEPSRIYEVLNRHLAEKFGISVEWPSLDNQRKER